MSHINHMWHIPCWPFGPFVGLGVLLVLVAIAGFVFSIVMLIDCLKRPRSKFYNPITTDAEYDKLIWALAIVASFWFYFLGAIIYFFVVKSTRPEQGQKQ